MNTPLHIGLATFCALGLALCYQLGGLHQMLLLFALGGLVVRLVTHGRLP